MQDRSRFWHTALSTAQDWGFDILIELVIRHALCPQYLINP